jgi:FixJ family two-component response regulator
MKLINCIEDDNSSREFLICVLKTENYEISNFTEDQGLMEKLKYTIPAFLQSRYE